MRQGDDLRRWLRAFLEGFRVDWLEFEPLAVETAGHLAYHAYSYSWRVTPRAGGEPIEARGKGLHILRREADGAWRIAREIWNASPAPARDST